MKSTESAEIIMTVDEISDRLRQHGVTPTRQRIDIAQVLLKGPVHLTADEVCASVRADGAAVSRATVYNTLNALVESGLVRQVVVDPGRVYYDSNTSVHHHIFDTDTGELLDIPHDAVGVSALPALPEGKQLDGIDVIVRVSSTL